MCGRFTVSVSLEELLARYDAEASMPFHRPSYNVAPTQQIAGVVNHEGKKELRPFKWGLIPPWSKDAKIAFKTINARAETVAEKPMYRNALKHKRILIPADSFYEWKKEGKEKQPMRFQLKSEEIFSFAGLYEVWKDPEENWLHTCSIITSTPNELVSPVHDRMPVILKREDEDYWLDSDIKEPEMLVQLFKPYPAEEMKAYPVSKRVGNVKNNDKDLLTQIVRGEVNSL